MTVLHILLVCPNWQDIRQEIGFIRRDIRWALTTKEGASLAIKFILRTGLLEQFHHYASETYGIRVPFAQEMEEEEREEEKEKEKKEEEEKEEKKEEREKKEEERK
jgi:hypothetical protein